MKKCPFCAEDIQDDAIKCRYCGEFLNPSPQGAAGEVSAVKMSRKWYFKTPVIVLAFLCVGPFVLPLIWWNPYYSRPKKIISTIIIAVLTYGMMVLSAWAYKEVKQYYDIIFEAGGSL